MPIFSSDPGKYNGHTQIARLGNAGGGGGVTESVTYAAFHDLLINGNLTPGNKYRITDYRSKNFLHGVSTAQSWIGQTAPTVPNFNPFTVYIGDTEVLVVTAISSDRIDMYNVYSENHPQDIIAYNPYINQCGFYRGIYNGDNAGTTNFDLQWDAQLGQAYFEIPLATQIWFGRSFEIEMYFVDTVNSLNSGFYLQVQACVPGVNTVTEYYGEALLDIDVMTQISITPNGRRIYFPELSQTVTGYYDADSAYIYGMFDDYYDCTGHIMVRFDTAANIKAPCDWRGRKYRRWRCNDAFATNKPIVYNPGVQLINIMAQDPTATTFVYAGIYGYGLSYTSQYYDFDVFSIYNYINGLFNNVFDNISIEGYGHPDSNQNQSIFTYFENTVFLGNVQNFKMDFKYMNDNTFIEASDVIIENKRFFSEFRNNIFTGSISNSHIEVHNPFQNVNFFGQVIGMKVTQSFMNTLTVFDLLANCKMYNGGLQYSSLGGYWDNQGLQVTLSNSNLDNITIIDSIVEQLCVRGAMFSNITIENCMTFQSIAVTGQCNDSTFRRSFLQELLITVMQNNEFDAAYISNFTFIDAATYVNTFNFRTVITSAADVTNYVNFIPILGWFTSTGWSYSTNLNLD